MFSKILNTWNKIVNVGVNEQQSYIFSDKLQSRNKLSFLCAVFSIPYVLYFLSLGLLIPFVAISFGVLLFGISIVLNNFKKYNFSSSLILFTTNFCVLFFSIYLGFNSGIHLYLFTSPLIVLTLFDTKNKYFLSISMISYLVTFLIIILFDKFAEITFITIGQNMLDLFYLVNFIFCFIIIISLSLYFFINNNRINNLLVLKNDELINNQKLLEDENKTRKHAEEKAILSLRDREILLSEIHHRVKNNLAVVNGLLELQTTYLIDENTIVALRNSQNRIKSIALLHEKLYENKTLKMVNMSDYIKELAQFIKLSSAPKKKNIKFICLAEPINLEMEKAMPFALLLNELMSNSYKYAFKNKDEGLIEVHFKKEATNYIFEFIDDGAGFDYNIELKKDTLGLNLIGSFSEQLNGKFEFVRKDNRMYFQLKF